MKKKELLFRMEGTSSDGVPTEHSVYESGRDLIVTGHNFSEHYFHARYRDPAAMKREVLIRFGTQVTRVTDSDSVLGY